MPKKLRKKNPRRLTKRRSKKGFSLSLILIFLTGLLCAVIAVPLVMQSMGKVVKIGFVAEISGERAAVGASSKNAAEMAVDEINNRGGIRVGDQRVRVDLISRDNFSSVSETEKAVNDLITAESVVAVIGPNASRFAIPASTIAELNETLLISPWSTDVKTTLDEENWKPKQYVFRTAFTDVLQSQALAKFAYTTMTAKRAAVLYDGAEDVLKGQADYFRKTFEAEGGSVVIFANYTLEGSNISSILKDAQAAEVDVIFLPSYYTAAADIIKQAKTLGVTTPFLGSDAWGNKEFLRSCGDDCNGFFLSAHYSSDIDNYATKKFVADYKRRYANTPDDVAALTYDSFKLLFKAIEDGESVEKTDIRNVLSRTVSYDGVTGFISYKATGDPVKSVVILKIDNNEFVWYKNISL